MLFTDQTNNAKSIATNMIEMIIEINFSISF